MKFTDLGMNSASYGLIGIIDEFTRVAWMSNAYGRLLY